MIKTNFKKSLFYSFIVIVIITLDRLSKLYVLNLAEIEQQVDIYIFSYLNLYLIWNTGVGFGLFSSDQSFYYNLVTIIIFIINILILIMIFKSNIYRKFLLLMILGGSLGNLFDRLYYSAVPDFIDIHYENYHWFVFNVADIFITTGIIGLILFELFKKGKVSENF